VLIDGNQLTRLMIRPGVGCRIEETLYVKKVDEEFPEWANEGLRPITGRHAGSVPKR
jgi:hypothetical protein